MELAEGVELGLAEGADLELAEGAGLELAEGAGLELAEGAGLELDEGAGLGLGEGAGLGLDEEAWLELAEEVCLAACFFKTDLCASGGAFSFPLESFRGDGASFERGFWSASVLLDGLGGASTTTGISETSVFVPVTL